ncbi:TetR/AcrR family transcriptional regulator [Desulfosarcina ovata]|nr:TetR/AcrR family transcriptional regulator [Desulfosarcina ovata]
MVGQKTENKGIPTLVKNQALVEQRRRQIVDAAVTLFIQNGFHKTTTRQIAQASGISIGSLYEYIATKEDVLYLVCDAIHAEIEHGVAEALERARKGRDPLAEVIREYFMVCHQMNDHILLIYQETQSLPGKWRRIVLENEIRITGTFTRVLADLMATGALPHISPRKLDLVAHTISVLGHMWTFRRWFLANHYSVDEYITLQTQNILGMCHENAS